MNEHVNKPEEDVGVLVSVFKNGRSRAIRIPKEFDFEADKAMMVRQPDGSILMRTAVTAGLVNYLRQAEAWDGDDFLAGDEDEGPQREIDL